ncbi:hypothetical protein FRC02_001118 [Tulasnella sp. 418]|nr:hypothetical protein FRC02_001118 [Tulasnella sp. 418]
MEAAGLAIGAIGLIPVVVKCGEIAFSIRRLSRNISVGFQERVTQLCEEIVNLEDKLAEVKEANPKSTMLLQHVNDLKAKLENLQEVLQDLVPTKLWKRSIYHDTIDLKLTELLQVVETCNSSFVASSTCHLVCTNEKIRRDVEKVQVVEHKTDSLIIAVSDLRQQMVRCNGQAKCGICV